MKSKRIDWVRKLLAFFILLFALVYYFTNTFVILTVFFALLIVFFLFYSLDYFGNKSKIVKLFLKLYPKKEEDKNTLFPSDIKFFISTIILVIFFPKDIVVYSLIILTFCDDAEQIFGIKYKIVSLFWNKDKNLAGLIAGFFVAVIVGILSINIFNLNIDLTGVLLSSIVASLAGTVKKYDNEIMPWSVAIVLFILK